MPKMTIIWSNGDQEDFILTKEQLEVNHNKYKNVNWSSGTNSFDYKDGRKIHIAWQHVREIIFED